jgi:hypothetical protein
MAVSAVRRAAAYAAKLDTTVLKARVDARKVSMISEAGVSAANQADIEAKTRSVLGGAGTAVPVTLVAMYIAFARRVGKIVATHSGKTVAAEAQIVKTAWTSRGLTSAVLNSITLDLYGITTT